VTSDWLVQTFASRRGKNDPERITQIGTDASATTSVIQTIGRRVLQRLSGFP
jgi:hypothetical protein